MTDSPVPPVGPWSGPAKADPPAAWGAAPPPPPLSPPPVPAAQPVYVHTPRRASTGLRILLALLIVGLLGSLLLVLLLSAALGCSQAGAFTTHTIMDGSRSQVVAVYDIVDLIDAEQADAFSAFARQVSRDDDVRAVVLRVDSGGGGVSASDQMHQEVRRLKSAGKKVVVAMGGMAASGGYYVSAPADYIFAEPTTVTGSIGVISIIPILKGTLERIGAQTVIIRSTMSTPRKADLNPFESPSPQAQADHQALLDKMHRIFMKVVQDGRPGLTPQEVMQLSDGRVWMGEEAVHLKLVDEIGYLDNAVTKAALLAGLPDPRALRYTERRSLLDLVSARSSGLTIDARLVENLQAPRIMLLWRPQWD